MIRGTIVTVEFPDDVRVWVDAETFDDGSIRATYRDGWYSPTADQIADAIRRVESGEIPIPVVVPAPVAVPTETDGWGWAPSAWGDD